MKKDIIAKFREEFSVSTQDKVNLMIAPAIFLGNYFDNITNQINAKLGISPEIPSKIDEQTRLELKLQIKSLNF